MKKSLFLLIIFVFLSSLSFSQGYQIKIKINGLNSGYCKLAYYYGDKKLLVDSAQVDSKGNLEFKGDKALKEGVYLIVTPGSKYFEFIANKNQSFSMSTDTIDYVMKMTVKGNQENEDFYNYLKQINPIGKELDKLNKEYMQVKENKGEDDKATTDLRDKLIEKDKKMNEIKKSFIATHPDYLIVKVFKAMEEVDVPEMKDIEDESKRSQARYNYYKNHFFDNIDLSDDRMIRTPVFHARLEKFIDKIVPQIPDSIIAASDNLYKKTGTNQEMFKYLLVHITGKYEKSNLMCIDEVPYYMFENYFLKDKRVDWLDSTTRVKIEEQVIKTKYNRCGLSAPNLTMADTNGVSYKLSNVAAEYTLVYFWSATCGHCKKTTPKLHDMYLRMKDQYDFEVYSVCIDKDLKEYKKYMKKNPFTWINVVDPDEKNYFRVWYNIYSTPTMYLLDHQKKIIAKRIDIDLIEKIIQDKEKRKD